MDLWHPPNDQPHLLEWWRPLVQASRAARLARCPWPIHIDDVMLMGRIDRGPRPSIWVYKHVESRGELYLDGTGQAYKFTKTPNGRSLGRFTRCDIQAAVWRAGLPSFVQPLWHDEPPRRARDAWALDAADHEHGPVDEDDHGDHDDRAHRVPRSRGHLTLIGGGRPLAG